MKKNGHVWIKKPETANEKCPYVVLTESDIFLFENQCLRDKHEIICAKQADIIIRKKKKVAKKRKNSKKVKIKKRKRSNRSPKCGRTDFMMVNSPEKRNATAGEVPWQVHFRLSDESDHFWGFKTEHVFLKDEQHIKDFQRDD